MISGVLVSAAVGMSLEVLVSAEVCVLPLVEPEVSLLPSEAVLASSAGEEVLLSSAQPAALQTVRAIRRDWSQGEVFKVWSFWGIGLLLGGWF